jgi:hypothetical protein
MFLPPCQLAESGPGGSSEAERRLMQTQPGFGRNFSSTAPVRGFYRQRKPTPPSARSDYWVKMPRRKNC